MKKLLFGFVLVFLSSVVVAQPITEGKYGFALVENQQMLQLQNGNGRLVTDPTCAANITTCTHQIWIVKKVPGRAECFTLQSAKNNKFLTWSIYTQQKLGEANGEVQLQNRITEETAKQTQEFFIYEATNGITIRAALTDPRFASNNNFLVAVNNFIPTATGGIVGIDNKTLNIDRFSNSKNAIWKAVATLNPVNPGVKTVIKPTVNIANKVVASPNKLEVDIRTGDDNLEQRSFQKPPAIIIKLKNKPDVVVENINKNQDWANGSNHRVIVPLAADVTIDDLVSLELNRVGYGSYNNVDGAGADNWKVAKITANAVIKVGGQLKRTLVLDKSPERRGGHLFRFRYENRTPEANAGNSIVLPLAIVTAAAVDPNATISLNITIKAEIGTGGDNLEGGDNNNIDLFIYFKDKEAPLVIRNLNNKRKLNNFSNTVFTKSIPSSTLYNINDIEKVIVAHTGGGGIAADNWYLDKFKLTAIKGAENKVVIDELKAPIHYFTGDTRRKTFTLQ